MLSVVRSKILSFFEYTVSSVFFVVAFASCYGSFNKAVISRPLRDYIYIYIRMLRNQTEISQYHNNTQSTLCLLPLYMQRFMLYYNVEGRIAK